MRVPNAKPPVSHCPEKEPKAARAVPLLPDDGFDDVVGEKRGNAIESRLDWADGVDDREDLVGDEEVVRSAVVEP